MLVKRYNFCGSEDADNDEKIKQNKDVAASFILL
jgi:hypothetical protein